MRQLEKSKCTIRASISCVRRGTAISWQQMQGKSFLIATIQKASAIFWTAFGAFLCFSSLSSVISLTILQDGLSFFMASGKYGKRIEGRASPPQRDLSLVYGNPWHKILDVPEKNRHPTAEWASRLVPLKVIKESFGQT
jgi:hypothetical protein